LPFAGNNGQSAATPPYLPFGEIRGIRSLPKSETRQYTYQDSVQRGTGKSGDDMKIAPLLLVLVIIPLILVTGCTQYQQSQPVARQVTQAAPVQTIPAPDSIKIGDTSAGKILVDSAGKTLYYFAKDTPASGASACSDQCTAVWPVFYVDTVTVSSPLVASDFSSVTRTDGKKQTTYRGLPLYYYQPDVGPGDMRGEGFANVWFVAGISGTLPPTPSLAPTTFNTLSPYGGGTSSGGGGGY
jgi:predicted lipoprotein with Yx(FWY)xxD motif